MDYHYRLLGTNRRKKDNQIKAQTLVLCSVFQNKQAKGTPNSTYTTELKYSSREHVKVKLITTQWSE